MRSGKVKTKLLAVSLLPVYTLSLIGRGLVQQPAEPVDPAPHDGEMYYLLKQLSGMQPNLKAGSTSAGSSIVQNTLSLVVLMQHLAFTRLADGNWKISNIARGRISGSPRSPAGTGFPGAGRQRRSPSILSSMFHLRSTGGWRAQARA